MSNLIAQTVACIAIITMVGCSHTPPRDNYYTFKNLQVLQLVAAHPYGWTKHCAYVATVKNEWDSIFQITDICGPPPLWQGMRIRRIALRETVRNPDWYHRIYVTSVEQ